jgi:hypothetical protein
MLIALLLAFLTLGVSEAQAIIVIDGGFPVGITFGQTARVNILNTSDGAIIVIDGGKFVDSDGNVIAEFRGTIGPGKMMSFDLNADDIVRESNRIQIRVVFSANNSRSLVTSMEVFENATGKTTVFIGNPND